MIARNLSDLTKHLEFRKIGDCTGLETPVNLATLPALLLELEVTIILAVCLGLSTLLCLQ